MNTIPTSDFENDFGDITRAAQETAQPSTMINSRFEDIVVSIGETYEDDNEVYCKLQDAEKEAENTGKRYSSSDVLKSMKEVLGKFEDI